jgi:hypothetical protein
MFSDDISSSGADDRVNTYMASFSVIFKAIFVVLCWGMTDGHTFVSLSDMRTICNISEDDFHPSLFPYQNLVLFVLKCENGDAAKK